MLECGKLRENPCKNYVYKCIITPSPQLTGVNLCLEDYNLSNQRLLTSSFNISAVHVCVLRGVFIICSLRTVVAETMTMTTVTGVLLCNNT